MIQSAVRPLQIRSQPHQRDDALDRIAQTLAAFERVLEADDRGVVLISRYGRPPLLTRLARRWLAGYFGRPLQCSDLLPEEVQGWLARQRTRLVTGNLPRPTAPLIVERNGRQLQIRYLPPTDESGLEVLLCSEALADRRGPATEFASLTPREREVLRLVERGKSNREIAELLGVRERTVEKHLEHLLTKLGVANRTAAAAWSIVHGPSFSP